jgi:Methylase involved in ubiquinone/menaquinone biosynthesis
VSKFEHNLGPALFQSGLSGLALLKSLTAPQARITERLNELADDVDRARSMLDSGAQLPLSKVVQAADGYNVWAYNYDADNAANDMFATEEPIIRRLLRIAEQNKQARQATALDMACGTGRNFAMLHDFGFTIFASDISKNMLKIAQERGFALECRIGSFTSIPYRDRSFDLVLTTAAFSHEPNVTAAMREFARILRPGGILIISDIHPIQVWLGNAVNVINEDVSLRIPNYFHLPSSLISIAVRHGLDLLSFDEPLAVERVTTAHDISILADLPLLVIYSFKAND